MTCKNCFYDRVCPHLKDEDAEKCRAYTDKANVVAVVRCIDCKHWGGITYGCVCRWFSGIDTKICTGYDDYCSFGEKKDGKAD